MFKEYSKVFIFYSFKWYVTGFDLILKVTAWSNFGECPERTFSVFVYQNFFKKIPGNILGSWSTTVVGII